MELDRNGRTEEAAQAFREAAELGDFNAIHNLGLLAERAGRTAEARRWYEQAHWKGHPEAANNLGVLLRNAGDPDTRSWFVRATVAGHPQAAANLLLMDSSPSGAEGERDPIRLHKLAEASYRQFVATGEDAALVRAVNLTREAVRLVPRDHPERGRLLAGLRDVLRRRYGLWGRSEDLEEAVTVALTVPSELPPEHPGRMDAVRVAIDLLRPQCETTGRTDRLRSGVEEGRRTLARPGGTPRDRAKLEASVCGALATLELHTDEEADLDEAVRLGRAAVGRHLSGVVPRINLGAALHLRGLRRGSPGDLDEAVAVLREALEAADDPALRVGANMNLEWVLRSRADFDDNPRDRDEAERTAAEVRDALRALPAHQFRLFQAAEEGPGSAEAAARAVAALPPTHLARSALLCRLALALRTQDDLSGAVEKAGEAVTAARSVAARAAAQDVLGGLLLEARAGGAAEGDPLTEAVDTLRAAAAAWQETDVLYAEVRLRLTSALSVRFERDAVESDREEMRAVLRQAARAVGASAQDRMQAARAWCGEALRAGDTADALAGARIAVALQQEVGWIGLEPADRELSGRAGVAMPREAAALAIESGQYALAVELLEQGRSVLWRSLLHLRGDFSLLAERDPALAAELEEARSALNGGEEPTQEERRLLARRWMRLLARARGVPGLEDLLAPASFGDLASAADEGPVVIVNVSTIRCDAIVLRRGGRIDVVPLPELNHRIIDQAANRYRAHLEEAVAPKAGFLVRERTRHAVHDTLEWLWEHIARPVLDRLGWPYESEDPPRLWWCPTASLVSMPLHAAGRYPRAAGERMKPAGMPYAAVSSYTTGLATLVDARRKRAVPGSGILAVALTDTRRGRAALPGVARELRSLQEAVDGRWLRSLVDDAATVDAVREHLPRYAWAHFACHGSLDMVSPTTAGLEMWDGGMSVLDFADLHLEGAELAFLSACHTRVGSPVLPDEAIHSAAALRMAGFRHVVATLWTVSDEAAPRVAAAFYRYSGLSAGTDSAEAARALHHAVAELRDADPTDPTVWVPFMHDGP
ncbi:CHAT domain-containing protein [Streptomyces mangrovi]|uniref:CHAT domain-containing protein n=1 Tax=Streptomyces mangrovi TaxID=1206892 RepID=UPI00399CA919